jgi:hypothetical protein
MLLRMKSEEGNINHRLCWRSGDEVLQVGGIYGWLVTVVGNDLDSAKFFCREKTYSSGFPYCCGELY